MPAPLPLTTADRELVAAYREARRRAGLSTIPTHLWPAKAFCAQVGGIDGWLCLSLEEQCGLDRRIRSFVNWLAVASRLRPSADYVVAAVPQLGRIAARYHPATYALVTETSRELGYSAGVGVDQWSLFARLMVLSGSPPDVVGLGALEVARRAIEEAEGRLGPVRNQSASSRGGRGPGGPAQSMTRPYRGLLAVLFHAGLIDKAPKNDAAWDSSPRSYAEWSHVAPTLAATMRSYVDQCALTQRPATTVRNDTTLRELGLFLAERYPEVTCVAEIRRAHIEAFKSFLATRPAKQPAKGMTLSRATIKNHLIAIGLFFQRLLEWQVEDAPTAQLLYSADLPRLDQPLPRFLDDGAAAKLLQAARADNDPFVRLAVELLARTGLRKGELLGLTVDSVVQIGTAYWLRVPVGKLHTDRYVPLHPQLKALIDSWLAARPEALRSNLLFVERGRPMGTHRVDRAVAKVAAAAGIGRVTPHQLRHTLATQAVNRGMPLEAIAALLGHKTLTMTLVYARIADRTVAEEYFSVSEKVEALYDRSVPLPPDAEGAEMRKLRAEMHRRMLGNGYCARPLELDCHFESICESCSFFVTTIDFRPTLARQRDDAKEKGQIARQKVFEGLLARLDEGEAS